MRLWYGAFAVLATALFLAACGQSRNGGELRLKHIVTILTPEGKRTFSSVVSLNGIQTYNYGFGGSGWGGISCRLTGDAVRATVGDRDFYFLLAKPRGYTPASTQIGLIQVHFGLIQDVEDANWVSQWKRLAQSSREIKLKPEDYPAVAIMPHDGWMNDARLITLQDARAEGLQVVGYRLQITNDPVGADRSFEVRYRKAGKHDPRSTVEPLISIGREYFSVLDGRA